MTIHLDPTKKHDAIFLFDCIDGNPNGDPDASNQPRIDPETRQGITTDACLKRKIRDYISIRGKDTQQPERYKLFVEKGSVLNDKIAQGYTSFNYKAPGKEGGSPEQQLKVQGWLRDNFYDIRMFGAVLSTGYKAGQVMGPAQVSFARSFDPILPLSLSITRVAATNPNEGKDNKTMGRKELIPYGLYRSHIFYNPHLAGDKVTQEDLELFWEACIKCWEFDRSASRGVMGCRGLWIFTHESKYGNAPVHELFARLQVKKVAEYPRIVSDYLIQLDDANLPQEVTLTQLV